MTGIQQIIAEALKDLANKVETGMYGKNDDFDINTFDDDMNEITNSM